MDAIDLTASQAMPECARTVCLTVIHPIFAVIRKATKLARRDAAL
jgi:hypothetical protein